MNNESGYKSSVLPRAPLYYHKLLRDNYTLKGAGSSMGKQACYL